jgi:hypothetical protein
MMRRSLTGIEKCVQIKKEREMMKEMSESIMEAAVMVQTKKALGYGNKK